MRVKAPLFALAAVLALPVAALAQGGGVSFKSTELAPGLHMIEGVGGFGGGNLGILVGDDGAVLIDDSMPPLSDKILAAIAELTDKPIEFLINTHVHGDHIGNNQSFAEAGATIVAHDRLRERMVTEGLTTGSGNVPAPKDALPVVTFSDSVTFHLNGRSAYVFHVAAAHTDGDAIIHFREDNVIHAGDVMFNRLFPFIDLDTGGSVQGYIDGQKRILEIADAETQIVPGHGELATREDMAAAIAMLEDSQAKVRALVDAGKSEEEILAANPLAEYHEVWNWGFITTERMTKTLIRDLQAD